MCSALIECTIEYCNLSGPDAFTSELSENYLEADPLRKSALEWAIGLIESAINRGFHGGRPVESSSHLKNQDESETLESTCEMLRMMADLGFSSQDCSRGVTQHTVQDLVLQLDALEDAIRHQKRLPLLPPDQEVFIRAGDNVGLKEHPVPNIKELSLLLLPIMDIPEAFPLVERLAAWESGPLVEDNQLSEPFVQHLIDHREQLYAKFQLSTKVSLWHRHQTFFQNEVHI